MFAIFSALYDSIQASRLILRAPTVSPSIRNMYNSTAFFFFPFCFFFFFFYKHTLILLPALSDEAIQGKKRIVCLGDRAQGWWGSCWWRWIGAAFYSPRCPECCEHKLPCCSSRSDTNRLSHGRALPAEQSPTPIRPGNCQPVISNGHGGPDARRIGRAVKHTPQPGLCTWSLVEKATAVLLCLCVQALLCTAAFRGNNWLGTV